MKNNLLILLLYSLLVLLFGCTTNNNAAEVTTIPATVISVTPIPQIQVATEKETEMPPSPSDTPIPQVPVTIVLSSTAFENGAKIIDRYACHGEEISPALAWEAPPENTKSFVLIMDDPDAIPVAGFVWDHWVLFNIPVDSLSLSENIPNEDQLANGSKQGKNSSKGIGYQGPCPPAGQVHRYVFTIYAVDLMLDLPAGVDKAKVLRSIDGHVLAIGELAGTYP